MKTEWKKQEKKLYLPGPNPEVVNVPKQRFFMISGQGDPNGSDFSERVGVLYSLAYAVKMMPKSGFTPEGFYDYTVYPLEGIWDLTEEGRIKKEESAEGAYLDKKELLYTIMIRQPDFVTKEIVQKALETVSRKKPHPLLKDVTFAEKEDGFCVQMMHTGSYDAEPASFAKISAFLEKNGYSRTSLIHKEIYISDARKTEKEKCKTVLRVFVKG